LYFIAVIAPININQRVLEWKNFMLRRFNCKVALRSPAHITIIPPFHMPDSLEQPLIDAMGAIASQSSEFYVHLQDFGAFAPRVIYVHVQPDEPLHLLKNNTEDQLLRTTQFPIKPDPRPFHPHITIANRDLRKGDFPAAWAHFSNRQYQASFEAQALSLLRLTDSGWEVIADAPFNSP
jgi:2'-5' RNA ligase